jgi:hypothetical protein
MLSLVISYDQQTCEGTHNYLLQNVYSHAGFSLKIDMLFSCSYFVSYLYLGSFYFLVKMGGVGGSHRCPVLVPGLGDGGGSLEGMG